MDAPPRADVEAFFAAVWGSGLHSLCWKTPGLQFNYSFADTPAEVLADLPALMAADVWFGAHPMRDRPAHGRGVGEDVAEVLAVPADLDWDDPTRLTTDPLPTERELRDRLRRLGELAPSIVVNSGHGLQVWWLLAHPISPAQAEVLIGRINARLAEVGLVNGRPDLASILRVPGTINVKGDPVPVTFEVLDLDRRFGMEWLDKRLPTGIYVSIGAGGTRHRPGSVTDAQQELHDYVCEEHGGHGTYVAGDGSMHLTRPGKDARAGSSASIITGEAGDALLTVFSPHWADIGPVDGQASRSWRLIDDQLVPAYLDPLHGLTISSTTSNGQSAPPGDEPPPPAPPVFSAFTFEDVPDPFVVVDPEWHAIGLLARPTHAELAGAEKTLKSYTGLCIDVGLALGLPIFGRFEVPARQRVSLLVGEGGRDPWLRRLAAIVGGAYGMKPAELRGWLRFTTATASVTSPKFMDSVRAELETFGPSVLHLDPWYAYASGQADSRQVTEVGATLAAIGDLCASFGCSLLINHHFNRQGIDGLRAITGAGHAEWVDSWFLLKHRVKADVAAGRYRLRLDVGSRQWGGGAWDLDFDMDLLGGLTVNITEAAEEQEGEDEGKAERFGKFKKDVLAMGRQQQRPLIRAEWIKLVKGRDQDVRDAFDSLVAAGEIIAVSTTKSGSNDVVSYQVAAS